MNNYTNASDASWLRRGVDLAIIVGLVVFSQVGCELANNLDQDNDGVIDSLDNCPGIANPTQLDTDGDHIGDACEPDNPDQCPDDPNKTDPGICGCGVSDNDSDGDNTVDCLDKCPDDPNKTDPLLCGCGVSEGNCSNPGLIVTASAQNSEDGEGKEMAFDGNINTKWLAFSDSAWIQVEFGDGSAKIIRAYSITSANDFHERDPKDWTLSGSQDGASWDVLDTRSCASFSEFLQTKDYLIDNTTAYRFYRFELSNKFPQTANSIQLAEIQLHESQSGLSDDGCSDESCCEDDVSAVDPTTLDKKIMAGYQGWFMAEGDGSGAGWRHWFQKGTPTVDNLHIDFWPDLREYDLDELYPTSLKYADGSNAGLYSAYSTKTVRRHVKWMKDYGIDGVFVQRFLIEAMRMRQVRDQVLQNVRSSAEIHGRVFVNMYDISGATESSIVEDLKNDWMHLVDDLKITQSDRYLRHKGKPLLAIWGFGFADRPGSTSQAAEVIKWFKTDAPEKYRVTLMGGIDDDWLSSHSDAWKKIYLSYDVISPWAVGRYGNENGADDFRKNRIEPDLQRLQGTNVDYLPVVFPGFSWYNLKDGSSPLNKTARNGGKFIWRQFYNAMDAGCNMVYVAMYDEMDEGTAIFKVAENASQTPASGKFVTLDQDGYDLPSDWYLRLTGAASKMLRGEIGLTSAIPISP